MDSNKKVCVGCLELIESDNLVLNEKSIYWHKSCLDNLNQTPKANSNNLANQTNPANSNTNQKSLPIKPSQWYSWDPYNSSTPSYPVNIFDVVSNLNDNSHKSNTKAKYLEQYYIYEKLKAIIEGETFLENNQILQEETLQEKDKAWEEVIEELEETTKASQEEQLGEESWEDMKKYHEKKPIELKTNTEAFDEFIKFQKELEEPEMVFKKKKNLSK
jgi:hypothetical protein